MYGIRIDLVRIYLFVLFFLLLILSLHFIYLFRIKIKLFPHFKKIIRKVTLSVIIIRLFIIGINLVGVRMLVCIQDNPCMGLELIW